MSILYSDNNLLILMTKLLYNNILYIYNSLLMLGNKIRKAYGLRINLIFVGSNLIFKIVRNNSLSKI